MGRIKTTLVKRVTWKLFKEHPDRFTTDFNKNKKESEKLLDIPSKKLRNVIAGYLVRLVKQKKSKEA